MYFARGWFPSSPWIAQPAKPPQEVVWQPQSGLQGDWGPTDRCHAFPGLAEGAGAAAPSFTVLSSTAGLPPGAFDAVVSSLVMCSVDDVAESATDLYRWLKPGGTLLFMEHMAHGQQTKAKALCDKCAPTGLGHRGSWLMCVEHMAHGQQTKAKRLCDKCAPSGRHQGIGFKIMGYCAWSTWRTGSRPRPSACATSVPQLGDRLKSMGFLYRVHVTHGQRGQQNNAKRL